MPISLDEFLKSLTETGILPTQELTSIVSSLPDDRAGVDVEKLAQELVRQQKLTRFQASVIFRRQSRGLRIGDYIVLDKIGSGGMGQVFKAENRKTHELVALKLLRASFSKSEKAVARFYREANTASRLKHRNLVSVCDAGEWNGLHYLVMEMIEGREIRSIIKEKGPLTVKSAIDVVLQTARGLEYAHQHGIVHRDIKPANLLLDRTGRVVVLDLGLARLEETANEEEGQDVVRLTMPGHFMGTLEYASPEQAVDAHEVDGRTDIYSLGCTLYYLLRGRPPFRRETVALILLAHCQDPIPDLQAEVTGVSDRLGSLFRRMMAKKVADRCVSMTEVISELEICQQEIRTKVKSPSADSIPVVRVGAPVPEPQSSEPAPVSVAAPRNARAESAAEHAVTPAPPPSPVPQTPPAAPLREDFAEISSDSSTPERPAHSLELDRAAQQEEEPGAFASSRDNAGGGVRDLRFWLWMVGAVAIALAVAFGTRAVCTWIDEWLHSG